MQFQKCISAILGIILFSSFVHPSFAQREQVIWEVVEGVNVSTNQTHLTKTAPNGDYNAKAVTKNTLQEEDNGSLELEIVTPNLASSFGFSIYSEAAKTNSTLKNINYAFLQKENQLFIYESGTYIGNFGAAVAGTVLKIERNGSEIHYYKDGIVIRTIATDPLAEYVLQVSLLDELSEVKNINVSFKSPLFIEGTVNGLNIAAEAMGGEQPYHYSWDKSHSTVSNLLVEKEGVYILTVKDNSGAIATKRFHVVNNITWAYENSTGRKISAEYMPRGEDGYLSFTASGACFGLYGLYAQKDFTDKATPNYGFLVNNGQVKIVEGGKVRMNLGTITDGNHFFEIERIGSNLHFTVDHGKNGNYTMPVDANKNLHFLHYKKTVDCTMSGLQIASTIKLTCGGYYQPDSWYWGNLMPISEINNYINTHFPEDDPDSGLNWVHTDVYDGLGDGPCNIISKKRVYADDMGKHTQTQVKDFVTNKVWVTETHYDSYGRAAISTLAAPSGINYIKKKEDFFLDANGDPYGVEDYDGTMTDNPAPVGAPDNNSLGDWYSANNSEDPYQAITSYPYARTEYSELTGAARRTAGAGDAYRMGNGHESVSYAMPVDGTVHEMNYLLGYKQSICLLAGTAYDENGYLSNLCASMSSNEDMRFAKSISIDADGKQAVVFVDLKGNEIARALSGQVDGANVQQQTIFTAIQARSYKDIHIPEGCGGSFSFSAFPSDLRECWNLEDDTEIDLTSGSILGPGFYRIVNKSGNEIQISYTTNYHNFTLNIHDLKGQLIATVAPNDINYNYTPDENIQPVHDLDGLSFYRFNGLGRLAWEQTPDRGRTEYFYRKDGSIRFSVDANQRAAGNRFSYTNYDEHHRIVESGVFVANSNIPNNNTLSDYLKWNANDDDFENDFNSSDKEEASYIEYGSPVAGELDAGQTQRFTTGRITKVHNEDETIWYSYDEFGRTEMVVKQVAGFKQRFINYQFDHLGNTTKVSYAGYDANDDPEDEFAHIYTYNREGQLQSVSTQEGASSSTKLQAKYQYNQGGSVKEFNLADGLQTLDYAYTLQGQLKAINPDELKTSFPTFPSDANVSGNDVFSMSLHYYGGDYQAANGMILETGIAPGTMTGTADFNYTGKIAINQWKTNAQIAQDDMSGRFAYAYQYNHRNELKSAQFSEWGQINPGSPFEVSTLVGTDDYKVNNITYDLNGNIQTLNRNAYAASGNIQMDELTYQYLPGFSGNRLLGIKDNIGNLNNLGDIQNTSSLNYGYDSMGQLTKDLSQDMKIVYNASGLVTEVRERSTNKIKIRYYYGPTGQRVKRKGFVYDDTSGDLSRIDIAVYLKDDGGTVHSIYERIEDKVDPSQSTSYAQSEIPIYATGRIGVAYKANSTYTYKYELTDHLGNVRAVIGEVNESLEVYSYTDYYPFGWKMPGRQATSGEKYRYGYQGQFAEEDEDANWVSFELRNYDARIARWTSIDPAEQFHSPYVSMGNDPVNMVDPDGAYSGPGNPILGFLAVNLMTNAMANEIPLKATVPLEVNLSWVDENPKFPDWSGHFFTKVYEMDFLYYKSINMWTIDPSKISRNPVYKLPGISGTSLGISFSLEKFGTDGSKEPGTAPITAEFRAYIHYSQNDMSVSPSLAGDYGGLELSWQINGADHTFEEVYKFTIIPPFEGKKYNMHILDVKYVQSKSIHPRVQRRNPFLVWGSTFLQLNTKFQPQDVMIKNTKKGRVWGPAVMSEK